MLNAIENKCALFMDLRRLNVPLLMTIPFSYTYWYMCYYKWFSLKLFKKIIKSKHDLGILWRENSEPRNKQFFLLMRRKNRYIELKMVPI